MIIKVKEIAEGIEKRIPTTEEGQLEVCKALYVYILESPFNKEELKNILNYSYNLSFNKGTLLWHNILKSEYIKNITQIRDALLLMQEWTLWAIKFKTYVMDNQNDHEWVGKKLIDMQEIEVE